MAPKSPEEDDADGNNDNDSNNNNNNNNNNNKDSNKQEQEQEQEQKREEQEHQIQVENIRNAAKERINAEKQRNKTKQNKRLDSVLFSPSFLLVVDDWQLLEQASQSNNAANFREQTLITYKTLTNLVSSLCNHLQVIITSSPLSVRWFTVAKGEKIHLITHRPARAFFES